MNEEVWVLTNSEDVCDPQVFWEEDEAHSAFANTLNYALHNVEGVNGLDLDDRQFEGTPEELEETIKPLIGTATWAVVKGMDDFTISLTHSKR